MRLFSIFVASCTLLLLLPRAVAAQGCPPLLEDARRLVLVTLDNMASSTATMRLFERRRTSDAWRRTRSPEPVVLGSKGAAWSNGFRHFGHPDDPEKREGDHRTPAGLFELGSPFGFAPSPLPRYLQLNADTVCVDDPTSAAYNRITSYSHIGQSVTAEFMRNAPLYRRGLVVKYPTDAATRAGSCIFIHVWETPTTGTAGCIALPEVRVAALQELVSEHPTVLAVLPDKSLNRLANCLPTGASKPH